MNKKYLIWIIPLFLIAIIAGAWFFSISGGFTMIVESLPGYATIDLSIPLMKVNTTEGSSINSTNISFILNKDMQVDVEIIETYQDNSGGMCFGGIDDCTVTYKLQDDGGYIPLYNGINISIIGNPFQRELVAELSCAAYSCPQSRTAQITLTEINS